MTYVIEYGQGMYFGDDIHLTPCETYDRDIFCCYSCYSDFIENELDLIVSAVHNTGPKVTRRITYTDGRETDNYTFVSAGEMPSLLSEYDYDVYCANCEDKMYDAEKDEYF